MYHHTMTLASHIKLNVVARAKSHPLSVLLPNFPCFHSLLTTPHHLLPQDSSEADQSSNHADKIPNKIPATTADSAAAVESEDHLVTSYSTMDDQTMAKKEVLTLHEYWKTPTVTNEDITAYHEVV
jgi:hypothetical protein